MTFLKLGKRVLGIGKLSEEEVREVEAKVPFKGVDLTLDGYAAIGLPKEISPEKEKELIQKFLNGLKKLLDPEANWTFYRPLKLTLDLCQKCHNCADACPIYLASGGDEIYRPNYRAEILRRIYRRYFKWYGKIPILRKFCGADIELNATVIKQLAELAYRCTLCRRCVHYLSLIHI